MMTFLIYEAKVAAALAIFYMFFRLLLKKGDGLNRQILVTRRTGMRLFEWNRFSASASTRMSPPADLTTSESSPTGPRSFHPASAGMIAIAAAVKTAARNPRRTAPFPKTVVFIARTFSFE